MGQTGPFSLSLLISLDSNWTRTWSVVHSCAFMPGSGTSLTVSRCRCNICVYALVRVCCCVPPHPLKDPSCAIQEQNSTPTGSPPPYPYPDLQAIVRPTPGTDYPLQVPDGIPETRWTSAERPKEPQLQITAFSNRS